MKKRIAAGLGLLFLAFPVFPQDFSVSAGAGGIFTMGLGGGVGGTMTDSYMGQSQEVNLLAKDEQTGFGGFAFIDATYAELGVAFVTGPAKFISESGGAVAGAGANISAKVELEGSFSAINISLLGKYPFSLGDSFTLFPLAGIDYQMFLSRKDPDGNEYKNKDGEESPGDFSSLWFKAGAGADFMLTENLFIRAEFLYGIRLQNKFDKDAKESLDEGFSQYPDSPDFKIELGHGPTAKIALGYKFF
jgi:opacity protein-like surface antigen